MRGAAKRENTEEAHWERRIKGPLSQKDGMPLDAALPAPFPLPMASGLEQDAALPVDNVPRQAACIPPSTLPVGFL